MLKRFILLFAISMVISVVSNAQNIHLDDLTGKWTLTKIDEMQVQGDTEISKVTFNPSVYGGEIYFTELEILSNEQINFGGKQNSDLGNGVNIQLYPASSEVGIHGTLSSMFFTFSWIVKGSKFSLVHAKSSSQQSQVKTLVSYEYTRSK